MQSKPRMHTMAISSHFFPHPPLHFCSGPWVCAPVSRRCSFSTVRYTSLPPRRKTLMTIALLWTLLKQSATGRPAITRAVVVCPSSLVGNWKAEIKKWLGDERVRPLAVTSQGEVAAAAVRDFVLGSASVRSVLIISYEMLRKHIETLTSRTGSDSAPRIGLLVW